MYFYVKYYGNGSLPELLVSGSEALLGPQRSAVFATGTLNVNPICRERRSLFSVHLASHDYQI